MHLCYSVTTETPTGVAWARTQLSTSEVGTDDDQGALFRQPDRTPACSARCTPPERCLPLPHLCYLWNGKSSSRIIPIQPSVSPSSVESGMVCSLGTTDHCGGPGNGRYRTCQ
jgi:hypothetical protein